MAGQASRAATEALRACGRIQRSHVDWISGLRTGVVVAIVILIAVPLQQVDAATSVAIGVLFIAIVDTPDATGTRLRTMVWGTLWIGLGVLAGGLVSESGLLHVAVAILIAGASGYAGALGPRGALIGVLSLVLFAVYAGAFVGADTAAHSTVYFALGGAITILVNLSTVPLRRLAAVRTSIARAYRELDSATGRRGLGLAAPSVAAEIMSARGVIHRLGCTGATSRWASGLLTDAERARIAFLALISQRERAPEFVDQLSAEAGRLCGVISHALSGPWGGRRARAIAQAQAHVTALDALLSAAPDIRLRDVGHELVDPLRDAVASLDSDWPIGSRATMERPPRVHVSVMARLRAHAHRDDPVTEHTLRLVIAFGGASLAAVLIGASHAYWLPLTVAWVAKPDLSSTVTRVTMRVAGTIAGLLLTSVIFLVVRDMPAAPQILAVMVGAASVVALAYLSANYPLAVVGITTFVLISEALAGESEGYDLIARLAATVVAGLWVLLISSIRPRRTGATAIARLSDTLTALRAYAVAVRTGVDVDTARVAVLTTRTAALASVTAASVEPPGIWERASVRVDPEQAALVLTDIIDAASTILAEELLERYRDADPSLWPTIDADLDDLQARISALESTT